MKIGMNLLLYTTGPDESIFPTCESLKAMGYDGLEWPLLDVDKKAVKKIGKFNKDLGLDATAVSVLGPGENPLSDKKSERKAALATVKKRIDQAAEIGAKMLCGPMVQPLGHFTGSARTQDEWDRCVEYLQKVGEYAAENQVTFVVEYLNRFEIYFLNTAVDAAKLCREVGSDHVKTMLDTFHMNIEEKNFYDPVMDAKDQVVHVHVSEHDRGIPGAGNNIRWDDFFRGLKDSKYDGYLTIESFSTALPGLAAAAKIWRQLFDSQEEVCEKGLAFVRKMLGK